MFHQNQRGCLLRGVAAALLSIGIPAPAEDLPLADFGEWTATGTAFQKGPATGDWLEKLEIENADGAPVASSEMEGDGPMGTLTSPEFTITKKYLAFRIGGGSEEHRTCVDLVIGGRTVRSATGWQSDRLVSGSWEVSRFAGQRARVRVLDAASGDWGHLNVARLRQTDRPERWPVVTEPLYREALRPQFHFTARQWSMDRLNPGMREEGWVNDLNGLIFYEGEYHLFAQRWAKCWLHAVSRDLVHWEELEPAFWEESSGSGVQSGTCVVDYQNTSGLSPDPATPPLVAFWSRFDNRAQCLSYSLDRGRTWQAYAKNPCLLFPERDPKVFWYAAGRHWVMLLYGGGSYHLLTSKNLLEWKDEHQSIPQSFECPDFFEMPVDGNAAEKKWVLIQGNGNYSIGTFNGVEFTEETARFPCDVGPHFYATQSWANTDTGDGRRIQAAWMRGAVFPDMPFNQMVSFPCELTLRRTSAGLRLFREPIREIALLHEGEDVWANRTLRAGQTLLLEPSGQCFHVQAAVRLPEGARLVFRLRGVPVVLTRGQIESGMPPTAVRDEMRTVEILVDRTSIEAFANHGEVSSTRFVLPRENGLSVTAEGGAVTIESLQVYPLKTAWAEGR